MNSLKNAGRLSAGFLVLVVVLVLGLTPLRAQETPIPPTPTRWVTDTVGFMPPMDVDRLDARLRAYQEETGNHLIVWIGSTTGDVSIEDWANRAFEKWGVGKKGQDNGLVLLIMATDHKLRIEVGYGLEAQVPDLLASRIIDQILVPGIRAGDTAAAVNAGMEAVAQAIGQPLPGGRTTPRNQGRPARELTLGQLLLYGVIGLVLLVVVATNPSLATWMLISLLSGGNNRRRGGGGGWGGGGGGGYSGGGGLSGGGGASGSW